MFFTVRVAEPSAMNTTHALLTIEQLLSVKEVNVIGGARAASSFGNTTRCNRRVLRYSAVAERIQAASRW
jgi:hypothetical protein